jgi:hypothetical protein
MKRTTKSAQPVLGQPVSTSIESWTPMEHMCVADANVVTVCSGTTYATIGLVLQQNVSY